MENYEYLNWKPKTNEDIDKRYGEPDIVVATVAKVLIINGATFVEIDDNITSVKERIFYLAEPKSLTELVGFPEKGDEVLLLSPNSHNNTYIAIRANRDADKEEDKYGLDVPDVSFFL